MKAYIAYADNLSGNMGVMGMTAGDWQLVWLDIPSGTITTTYANVSVGTNAFSKPAGFGNEIAVWMNKCGTGGGCCTPPAVSIASSGSTSFCQGNSVALTAGSGYSSYLWSTGDTTQSILVTQIGDYSVTVLDSNGCMGYSDTLTVTVHQLPSVNLGNDTTFTQPNPVTLDAGNPGASYSWLPTEDTTQAIIVNAEGVYSVIVTDSNGCMSGDTIIVTDVTATGLREQGLIGFIIAPNPTSDELRLSFEQTVSENISISVINMLGETVYSEQLLDFKGKNDNEIRLDGFPNGTYLVELKLAGDAVRRKIIKVK